MKGHFGIGLAVLALAVQMSGKIITPNGDGINDRLYFDVPASTTLTPETTVFNIRGQRIGTLTQVSPTRLSWDGRDSSGATAESGIYLFQIQQEEGRWTGVASLAK